MKNIFLLFVLIFILLSLSVFFKKSHKITKEPTLEGFRLVKRFIGAQDQKSHDGSLFVNVSMEGRSIRLGWPPCHAPAVDGIRVSSAGESPSYYIYFDGETPKIQPIMKQSPSEKLIKELKSNFCYIVEHLEKKAPIQIRLNDKGLFLIGNDEKNILPNQLISKLKQHRQKNPGRSYEFISEQKMIAEQEDEIMKTLKSTGVDLKHFWVPRSAIDLNQPPGPHGPGFVDVLTPKISPKTATMTFIGTVKSITEISKFNGKAKIAANDPQYVVTFDITSVQKNSELKDGINSFAIHSPSKLLGLSPIGKTFNLMLIKRGSLYFLNLNYELDQTTISLKNKTITITQNDVDEIKNSLKNYIAINKRPDKSFLIETVQDNTPAYIDEQGVVRIGLWLLEVENDKLILRYREIDKLFYFEVSIEKDNGKWVTRDIGACREF